ncbi:MAG: Mini-ribonuclease 3 [Clostridia bacterium]|nr:Mini-ribonuclease 3 [Clostridia bacterium]
MENDASLMSPLNLAYIGDSVFELMVREHILSKYQGSVKNLHNYSVSIVSANAQSVFYDKILDILSDKELSVIKRGRNAKVGSTPKHASIGEYHKATGFEALIGYLYLSKNYDRLEEIFNIIIKEG